MSETSEFLARLKRKHLKKIGDALELPDYLADQALRDAIEERTGQRVRSLVKSEVMQLQAWKDLLEDALGVPRRRSFGDLIADVRQHLKSGDTAEGAMSLRALAPKAEARRPPVTTPEGQFFKRDGVWEAVKEFLSQLPAGTEVIWVTYSFDPSKELVGFLAGRRLNLRVLCADPEKIDIQRWRFEMWTKAALGSVYYLPTTRTEDGAEPQRPLHAKALLAKNDGWFEGLAGSFNLAEGSLHRNTETLVSIDSQADVWWREAVALLDSPAAVELDDSGPFSDADIPSTTRKRTLAREIRILGAPAETRSSRELDLMNEPDDPTPEDDNPVGLRWLRRALDELLNSWPDRGPSRGWQRGEYQRLRRRMKGKQAGVLYLPVGVGKTFIALRWLLSHFSLQSFAEQKRGLFLAPNEWVARSVKSDVQKVVDLAKRYATTDEERRSIERVATEIFDVRRPSEFEPATAGNLIAVVADECHNWGEPDRPRAWRSLVEKGTYQAVVEYLRRSEPAPRMLGLSATPCRMELNKFDVPQFLSRFCNSDDPVPMLKLGDAIKKGLLAPYSVTPLLARSKASTSIAELLSNDRAEVAMGDYDAVVLRRVWEVLEEHSDELLDEIDGALRDSRRVLVFMPPVRDAGDRFVRALAARVKKRVGSGSTFFDFRDRPDVDRTPRSIFESFKAAQVSPGKPAVLVTVNRFSEGVSINDIDTLIFLRATLSPRLAVQALGRGLRLDPNNPNKKCKVYDAVRFKERFELWER